MNFTHSKTRVSRTRILAAAISSLVLAVSAHAQDALPGKMIWTSYDLGSSGHSDASAMANALQTAYDTRVRIVPSGTSIGRLLPMVTGKVQYGFLGNEVFFASEGTEDFADKSWGPQDLRVLMGRPSPYGFISTNCDKRPIKTVADLKGLRIAYVKGSPSINVKNDAILAFAGLTQDDVVPVWFGSWAQQIDALLAGQVDATAQVPSSGTSREVEASPGGICWAEMPASDTEGWARVQAIAGFMNPVLATSGSGISEASPKEIIGYRYPVLTTYASTSADEVYNLMKALHETFDQYKNATSAAAGWAIDIGGLPPYDAPAHEGAVRFLKEQGVWTDEHEAWNTARLARMTQVQDAWAAAVDAFEQWRADERAKGKEVVGDDAWLEFWADYRAKNL